MYVEPACIFSHNLHMYGDIRKESCMYVYVANMFVDVQCVHQCSPQPSCLGTSFFHNIVSFFLDHRTLVYLDSIDTHHNHQYCSQYTIHTSFFWSLQVPVLVMYSSRLSTLLSMLCPVCLTTSTCMINTPFWLDHSVIS